MTCLVFTELASVTRLSPESQETPQAYAKRLARKANDISEDAWAGLSEATQRWINDALEDIERSRPIALPEGAEGAMTSLQPKKQKPKAQVKAAAAPKKPKTEDGKERIPDTGTITILVEKNPHRPGSIRDESFKVLRNGMTVSDAVAAGARRQQIWSLANRGVIKVE